MTVPVLSRSAAAPRRTSIDRAAAIRLAATEYGRCAELFARLEPEQWRAPTINSGWDVRDTAGHMLGMVAMVSSLPQLMSQQMAAQRDARRAKAPVSIDALTALQVRRNAGLTTTELIGSWRRLSPKAVRGRGRLSRLLGGRTMPEAQLTNGRLERWTFGYLVDVILTRDPFMHRLDISAAAGVDVHVTPDHDGRLVDDVVREWAARHGQPYTLELTGPAGGVWGTGGGEHIRLDALDFCRIVSGRGDATGLLTVGVPF
jgi:uncharacterized protein (TIGR03083 family)